MKNEPNKKKNDVMLSEFKKKYFIQRTKSFAIKKSIPSFVSFLLRYKRYKEQIRPSRTVVIFFVF